VGSAGMALLWLSHDRSGLVTRASSPLDSDAVRRFSDAVARKDSDWRPPSVAAGRILLDRLPPTSTVRHLLIVTAGPLHLLPFEALTMPDAASLVVERFDVSYLPSAFLLVQRRVMTPHVAWPWQRELVAFGDPAPASSYPLETAAWPALPYAADEVRRVARA